MNENNTHPLTEARAATLWDEHHAPANPILRWALAHESERKGTLALLRATFDMGREYERAEADRPWVPLGEGDPLNVGDEVRRDHSGVTTIGVVASVDGEGDPFTAEGYLIGLRSYGTWCTRPAVLEGGAMNKRTDSNDPTVQVIENANPDDIQAGDHVTWVNVREIGGVIITERREGTAHHRDEEGNWHSKDGIWLAGAVWPWQEAPTITIHRPLPGLPAEDGAVIVHHERGAIQAKDNTGHLNDFHRLTYDEDTLTWYGVDLSGNLRCTTAQSITPGTWRAA